MAITPDKIAVVEQMKADLTGAKGAVLVGYKGLTVKNATALRRRFLAANVEYKVIKNTLTRIAAAEIGIDAEFGAYLEGPTAIAISKEDAVAPAKVLKGFLDETKSDAITVKAGLVEGKVIDKAGVEALASLPSREVLLAKLLGSMQAPVSGVVNVLQGNIRNVVYVLDAIREQKQSA